MVRKHSLKASSASCVKRSDVAIIQAAPLGDGKH